MSADTSVEKQIELLIVWQKKGIGIMDSKIWSSNFGKDVTNISFEDYCGSLSNLIGLIIHKNTKEKTR